MSDFQKRNFNDFALKYTRVIFYLAVFCCFLFPAVLASTTPCSGQYPFEEGYDSWMGLNCDCPGGSGTSGSPFTFDEDIWYHAQTIGWTNSFDYYPLGFSVWSLNGVSAMPPAYNMWFNIQMKSDYTGAYFIINGVKYYGELSTPATPTPTPEITFVPGPTMTLAINNTTWQDVNATIVIPTLPPNLTAFDCACGPLYVNFNNTLIPEDLVQDYFDMVDDFFDDIHGIIDGVITVILGPVYWIISMIDEVNNSLSSALSTIQYALLPIAIFMQLVFDIIPLPVQYIMIIVLTLDLIWIVLHGRK